MKIFLDDDFVKQKLYPFTATRHTADIRVGILTIREKWAYLSSLFSDSLILSDHAESEKEMVTALNANIVPSKEWVNYLLAGNKDAVNELDQFVDTDLLRQLNYPWEIFQHNDWALRKDFELITTGRRSQSLSSTNQAIFPEDVFLEEGAMVEHSILNASAGPIYIGKNAQVMEGCMIRGPFALCEGAVLKMGSKIYGATTIGPYSNAAGEIKNSVIFGFSNKAHDGYLGDSVIGEWCNLGAGTTNSNVKNTAGTVKVWSNADKDYLPAGLKCGLLMGDYSRSAINTSFNTGTVVGVCCNIFGAYFPTKFVSNFTWGEERYTFAKILKDIDNWKKFKGQNLSQSEIEILKQLYTHS